MNRQIMIVSLLLLLVVVALLLLLHFSPSFAHFTSASTFIVAFTLLTAALSGTVCTIFSLLA